MSDTPNDLQSEIQAANPIENGDAGDKALLVAEVAKLKADLATAQERLFHIEPVFHLAHAMFKIPNPYSRDKAQADILTYFRDKGYTDWYDENGV